MSKRTDPKLKCPDCGSQAKEYRRPWGDSEFICCGWVVHIEKSRPRRKGKERKG